MLMTSISADKINGMTTYSGNFISNPLDSVKDEFWWVGHFVLVIFKVTWWVWFMIYNFNIILHESLFDGAWLATLIFSCHFNTSYLEKDNSISHCLMKRLSCQVLTNTAFTIPQNMEKIEAARISGGAISESKYVPVGIVRSKDVLLV